MIDYYLENIRLGGSGPENYQKTLQSFRAVTADVIEEIGLVEQLPEFKLENGLSKTINNLNELYPGVSCFIVERVVELVGTRRSKPIYGVTADMVDGNQ